MFNSIPYVIQFVTDPKRSLDFYTRVLGLKLKANYDDFWIEIEAGNTVLALHGGQKAPAPRDSSAAYSKFSFAVDSVDRAIAHLKAHGVAAEYPPNEVAPGMFESSFRDPDGIQFGIYGPK
jgi:catechol 2,3-dioxygenase-like lactoylglutathione lyase family enzyme